jgi:hypothetical protein
MWAEVADTITAELEVAAAAMAAARGKDEEEGTIIPNIYIFEGKASRRFI